MTSAVPPDRAATNPIAVPSTARERWHGVDVPDSVVDRLREVCPTSTEPDADAGRDWWPLALTWAVAGEVPALPAAVVRPASADDVAAVLRICNEARVPVTAAGGRSGVCGASVPVFGGVTLDLTAMAGIVDVDDASLLVSVLPGTFGDAFEEELRRVGLTLGHWPQSIHLSTVGGWLACRSAGQYSTRYGKVEDMAAGLDVVLADGTVVRTGGRAPAAATGPDLTQMFVGSEGTLGVITGAMLRAHPAPAAERRGAWGFPTFAAGLDACRVALRRGARPAVLRLYDEAESQRNFDLATTVLIALDEGEGALVDATMAVVADACAEAGPLDNGLVATWLAHRNDTSALGALVSRGILVDTIEVAAAWRELPGLYDDAIAALRSQPTVIAASAHQSHAYSDGACLYFTWAARPQADDVYIRAWDAVTEATRAHRGAISHHHGVGINRGRYVEAALGPGAFAVLQALKAALDPVGILNPGKLGLPSPFGSPPWP
jgi:alkyldihydroxyacetonephosphate synthase